MAYDSYRDSNGITWTLIWPKKYKRHAVLATIEDGKSPRYATDPGDFQASMDRGGVFVGDLTVIEGPDATAEQQRVLMAEIIGKVEGWASKHRGETVIVVSGRDGPAPAPAPAKRGGDGALILLLLALTLA